MTEPLSDSPASSWTRRLYAEAGIRTSKIIYTPCILVSQIAELMGVLEAEIRRASR
jgi:hypothetical protein